METWKVVAATLFVLWVIVPLILALCMWGATMLGGTSTTKSTFAVRPVSRIVTIGAPRTLTM